MSRLRLTYAAVIVLVTLITACAHVIETAPEPAELQAPENFPRNAYEQAAAQGKPVYRVDPARSLIAITVRRGGSLARYGHDHIIASHEVVGYISPEESRADVYVLLNELVVDEQALRVEAGLNTQPSESDIAGTRANMLEKVLESQKFPFALISVNVLEKTQSGMKLSVAITLHGVTRTFEVPTQLETTGAEMGVSGLIEFNQSDFGIVPFSVLGGAIRVEDLVSLRFKISARRSSR